MVSLGIDVEGRKEVLGFWEGATENHEICEELLADMERRGLTFSRKILWITDGGKGIIKVLKNRFGKKLIHQRCTISGVPFTKIGISRGIWRSVTAGKHTGVSEQHWNRPNTRMPEGCCWRWRNGFEI